MRAAGISVWRIAGSVAMAGLVLMLFAVVCGEFLAPPLQAMAKQQKLLAKFSTITFRRPRRPLGARRRPAHQRDRSSPARGEFGGMRIFELTPDHELKSVATATTATVQPDGSWKLSHYASTTFRRRTHRIGPSGQAARFESTVGGDFLALTVSSPRQLETRVLWNLIRHLQRERSRRDRAGIRVLVAHRAYRGHPVRRAARRAVRLRQPALGGRRRAHAARRAHRRACSSSCSACWKAAPWSSTRARWCSPGCQRPC